MLYIGENAVFKTSGAQRVVLEVETSPAVFWKLKKMPWFWKKTVLIVCIIVLNHQNVVFRVSSIKSFNIFPYRALSSYFYGEVYRSALIPQNLPCPENFLVAHLNFCSFNNEEENSLASSLCKHWTITQTEIPC